MNGAPTRWPRACGNAPGRDPHPGWRDSADNGCVAPGKSGVYCCWSRVTRCWWLPASAWRRWASPSGSFTGWHVSAPRGRGEKGRGKGGREVDRNALLTRDPDSELRPDPGPLSHQLPTHIFDPSSKPAPQKTKPDLNPPAAPMTKGATLEIGPLP